MKKVLKFLFADKEGFLSVVERSDSYLALAQKDTAKIASIQVSHQLMISYDLKPTHFQSVAVEVILDPQIVREVYEQLGIENNLYFKTLDDSLCVLQIAKQ